MAQSGSNDDARWSLNRIFIGSLSRSRNVSETTVLEYLRERGYFAEDVKIIRDMNGRSKGYGFVDLERSPEGELQAAHLLSQHRMWFEVDSRRGFYAVFKPAYRKNKSGSIDVVRKISTNDVFTESVIKTVYEADVQNTCQEKQVPEAKECPLVNLEPRPYYSFSPNFWLPVFQYNCSNVPSAWANRQFC